MARRQPKALRNFLIIIIKLSRYGSRYVAAAANHERLCYLAANHAQAITMTTDKLSRRYFLQSTLAGSSLARLGVPGILALCEAACSARDRGDAFEILTIAEAREFDAIAARLLPTTDTPGAREAGVIYFMDRAFGSIMAGDLDRARKGLAEFQSRVSSAFPAVDAFSELSESDQDQFLRSQERSAFFWQMHFMTLCGFFGMSSYGGNRNNVGWDLLGFEGHHGAWKPPFGHYDAEVARGGKDGD